MVEVAGSSVLVTGGAGGLGEAPVRRLIGAGASVVMGDVSEDRPGKLAAELGPKAKYVHTDVTDEASVLAEIAEAEQVGPFRFAGVGQGGRGMAAAAVAQHDPDSDGQRGAVVMTASIAGMEGQIGQSAYAAAKAGVIGLTLVAARDLGPLCVRVVTTAPGTMRTPIMEKVGDEALAKFAAAIPNPRRLGRPEEYAALAQHILENPYLNGETIRLDGAQRMAARQ